MFVIKFFKKFTFVNQRHQKLRFCPYVRHRIPSQNGVVNPRQLRMLWVKMFVITFFQKMRSKSATKVALDLHVRHCKSFKNLRFQKQLRFRWVEMFVTANLLKNAFPNTTKIALGQNARQQRRCGKSKCWSPKNLKILRCQSLRWV